MSNALIPVLWFTANGCGPDELALELHPFAPDMGGAIPAFLGIQVRAHGITFSSRELVGGGFNLHREQAEELHRQLGEWLASTLTVEE
jgi:hypothetical protein